MKIRNIKTGEEGTSGKFNIHSLTEIFVYFDDWMDTDFMHNYEVFIEATQTWMTFNNAFNEKHLINDNHNTYFFEPTNEEDRERGYTLD